MQKANKTKSHKKVDTLIKKTIKKIQKILQILSCKNQRNIETYLLERKLFKKYKNLLYFFEIFYFFRRKRKNIFRIFQHYHKDICYTYVLCMIFYFISFFLHVKTYKMFIIQIDRYNQRYCIQDMKSPNFQDIYIPNQEIPFLIPHSYFE